MMRYAVAFLMLFALVCADVGPAPPAPEITLVFLENGTPYGGQVQASYNCTEPGESDSPVGGRTARFACDAGVCTNGGWFYKFNPCYYPKLGHIEYEYGGKAGYGSTGNLAFEDGIPYRVEIDLDTGAVRKITSNPGICPLSLGAVALVLALYAGRRAWN
jgi:hypothetical protein